MNNNSLNRRQFLKKTTSIAAGAFALPYFVPSSALGKAGIVSPSNRIVMGGVGVGGMGSGDMENFLEKKEVQFVALCDVDKNHRDKAKKTVDDKYGNNNCKTYPDFREMIGRGDLDAVFTAVPDHWHAIIGVAALKAGLDVHGQKPLARTIKEGRAICDAVKRYDRVWQTGSQQRSNSHFRHACELVRNGRIGKVLNVEVGLPSGTGSGLVPPEPVPQWLDWNMWLGPTPWKPYCNFGRNGGPHFDWRWIMDYSGGQLTDWAGHHIDIAHWGLGLDYDGPVEIVGKAEYPKDGLWDTPYKYKFTCKYKNGVVITVCDHRQLNHRLGTRKGWTIWYGDKGWIFVSRHALHASAPKILEEKIGSDEIHLYKSDDHRQNFLDCVKSRQLTVAPAEVGHRSISVGLLGEIAMLTGRKLKWDPDKELFIDDPEANRMLSRPMRNPWHL